MKQLLAFFIIFMMAQQGIMTSATPGDRVILAVQNLIDKTQKEQSDHQVIHDKQVQECKDDVAFRKQAIQDAKQAQTAAQTALDTSNQALNEDKAEIVTLNNAIADTQSKINNLDATRKQEKATFEQRQQEHEDTLNAISDAFQILDQFANANSIQKFVQLGEQVNKMFKQGIKARATQHFIPLLAAMAEISAPNQDSGYVDQSTLQKLHDLFVDLNNKVKQSKTDLINDENQAITQYGQNRQNLVDQKQRQEDRLNKVTNHRDEMISSVAQETDILNKATEKFNRNTQILQNTENLCASFESTFQTESKNRQEHVKLLQQLKSILQDAISNYSYGKYSGTSLLEKLGLKDEVLNEMNKESQQNSIEFNNSNDDINKNEDQDSNKNMFLQVKSAKSLRGKI